MGLDWISNNILVNGRQGLDSFVFPTPCRTQFVTLSFQIPSGLWNGPGDITWHWFALQYNKKSGKNHCTLTLKARIMGSILHLGQSSSQHRSAVNNTVFFLPFKRCTIQEMCLHKWIYNTHYIAAHFTSKTKSWRGNSPYFFFTIWIWTECDLLMCRTTQNCNSHEILTDSVGV